MNYRHTLFLTLAVSALMPAQARRLSDTPVSRDRLEERLHTLNAPEVAAVMRADTLDGDRREALTWLYAYMPLADIADYTPEYYLRNIDATLRALDEMPWGLTIPERELRHFVLPIRVNNEALDDSRTVFYEELRDRVRGLSMEDAILEVNHWCHEKATYQPSDGRTSSPLSTVSQAIGRCGEESTFTVAALRAVGIPARQVYTPRWAHTDDNHAWVEAWADGRWHFIGACEPEPILDLAWFNAPASRGMMMSTTVPGAYDGPEEVLASTPYTTTINVTDNYAPTGETKVRVTDASGKAVAGIDVDFCLYNYASLFTLATRRTDERGEASLLTGLGDVVVWASDGDRYAFAPAGPKHGAVTLCLDVPADSLYRRDLSLTPPPPSAKLPTPTEAQREANGRRLVYEDSVRGAYVATFTDPMMRGNSRTLQAWLQAQPVGDRAKAEALLASVNEKDLRDISTEVLDDVMANTPADGWSDTFMRDYVLSPRVMLEHLRPWRGYLQDILGPEGMEALRRNPASVVTLIADSIRTDDGVGSRGAIASPAGSWRTGRSDRRSRQVLAVALLRSAGVPARVDAVTGKTQWADAKRQWHDLWAEENTADDASRPEVRFAYDDNGVIHHPKYFSHFTLSRMENGRPVVLEFDDFMTIDDLNAAAQHLDAGTYMLMSGQRLADGSVLGRAEFVYLDGEQPLVTVTLPVSNEEISVTGAFDSETRYADTATGTEKSILSTTGRGYYVLGLIGPGQEPTVHVLNELAELAGEFETDGRRVVLLAPDAASLQRLDTALSSKLPSTVAFGIDDNGAVARQLTEELGLDATQLPLLIVADTFNRVVYTSQGYTIGTGERLLNLLRRLGKM